MGKLIGVLNMASAVTAGGAAVFWYRSAARLPPALTYWGGPPPDDPRELALQAGAWNNRTAAGFACASALLQAAAMLLR